jgi:tetratricopeptide (TPR) repeat protein
MTHPTETTDWHSRANQSAHARFDPVEAFKRAEALAQQQRVAEAEQIYRQLLLAFPNEVAVLFNLALLVKSRGDLNEAEALLWRAVDWQPKSAALLNALGVVLAGRGKAEEAEAIYLRAIAIDAGDVESRYNLGVLLERNGHGPEALESYRESIKLRPDHSAALTRVGALLIEQGLFAEAISALDAAIAASPDYFDALYYRGWALSKLGKHDEALLVLESARTLRPNSFEVDFSIANALRDAARHDEALAAYQKLIEQRPDATELHVEFNNLAWASGRRNDFLTTFAIARKHFGNNVELMYLEALFHMRRDNWAAAENLLARAYRMAPDRADIAGQLARALSSQGRFEESYRLFMAAITLDSDALTHQQQLGFALLRDHQPAQALKIFERALVRNSDDQLSLAGLSLTYRELADSRYQQLVDHAKYVGVYDLAAPEGFADSLAFNRALAAELDALHTTKMEPLDQTLHGGTQTTGQLFEQTSGVIVQVRESIQSAITDYIRNLPDNPQHPMNRRRKQAFGFTGSWSCRLQSEGFHTNHVHPQGWISSAYYARLPFDQGTGFSNPRGWLGLGASNLALGNEDRMERFVQPKIGRLVLFPSFYWHGTVPFTDSGDRLSVAFDVVPQ